jgi:predicted nucleic acid-binding protein
MSERSPVVVVDASVLVKLFRDEPGTEAAVELMRHHGEGKARVVAPMLCAQEATAVAVRLGGVQAGRTAWAGLRDMQVPIIEFDDVLADATFAACETYGCTFYDGVAPALADLIGATLWSADGRAHGRVPGVVLLG